MNAKAILIHGNGSCNKDSFWLPYVATELRKLNIIVLNINFPDSVLARAQYWLPFIKQLDADENTILIGHSSGAIAAMRHAEENKILGSVLVSAYYTDLNDEDERQSGYFNHSWNWNKIRENQKWIIQFASTDDPWIPIEEPRFIHEKLNTIYYEYIDQGHFGLPHDKKEFPEIIAEIKKALQIN